MVRRETRRIMDIHRKNTRMMTQLINVLVPIGGLALGCVVGYAFGAFQNAARSHNTRLQKAGKLKNGWKVMPGSSGRVAILLVGLTSFQLIFPFLFNNSAGVQWLISAGVVLGYGWTLFQQLLKGSYYNA